MGLATVLLDLQLNDRLSYDAERNTMFANFEGLAICSSGDIESVHRALASFCDRVGHKVSLIVNYDGFRLDDSQADAYFEMVKQLQLKYYVSATRFTTSAFMRIKLDAAFCEPDGTSRVCATHREATQFVSSQPKPGD
jgi:propionate CoA-transferase